MGQRNVMQGLLSRIAVGVFALLTIAMILLAVFDERGVLASRERREKRDALHNDVDAATKKNEELQQEIFHLRSDRETIERRAREQLNLVKPDEIILQTPKSQTPKPADTSTPAK